MSETTNWTEALQPGDQVCCLVGGWKTDYKLGVVTKVTKRHLVVAFRDGEVKFRRDYGRVVGGRYFLHKVTDSVLATIERRQLECWFDTVAERMRREGDAMPLDALRAMHRAYVGVVPSESGS